MDQTSTWLSYMQECDMAHTLVVYYMVSATGQCLNHAVLLLEPARADTNANLAQDNINSTRQCLSDLIPCGHYEVSCKSMQRKPERCAL